MDGRTKNILQSAGFDTDDAMNRFLGNEALYRQCLLKFYQSNHYDTLLEAIAKKDCREAFLTSHTLKGVCGNLSQQSLYSLFSKQTEYFRNQAFDDGVLMIPQISEEFTNVHHALSLLFSDCND